VAKSEWKLFYSVLDPIDRISEVLFGLIMVLTSTGTLSVATAGRADVKTMILATLFFFASIALIPLLPTGFIPPDDNSQTQVYLELPPGSTLDQTRGAAEHAPTMQAGG